MDAIKFKFKILVLGAVGVGRTALEDYTRKFNFSSSNHSYRCFSTNYRLTIGASFSVLNMDVNDIKIKFLFWVISEDRGFNFLLRSFLQNSVGAILMYDITNASSINRLADWRQQISEYCGAIPIVLAGNKLDLAEKRAILRAQGLEFQREHNITSFMEISIKTGEGVDKMFEYLRDLLLKKYLVE